MKTFADYHKKKLIMLFAEKAKLYPIFEPMIDYIEAEAEAYDDNKQPWQDQNHPAFYSDKANMPIANIAFMVLSWGVNSLMWDLDFDFELPIVAKKYGFNDHQISLINKFTESVSLIVKDFRLPEHFKRLEKIFRYDSALAEEFFRRTYRFSDTALASCLHRFLDNYCLGDYYESE
jgi:hypothetical protein